MARDKKKFQKATILHRKNYFAVQKYSIFAGTRLHRNGAPLEL
jgi:hypothetical protein